MNNSVVAQIRTPTDHELERMRKLWAGLKQKDVPASTSLGIELQTYFAHAVRMIGIVGGLHPVTNEPIVAGGFPLRVSEDGVARLHDSAKLCSAILSLWVADGSSLAEEP